MLSKNLAKNDRSFGRKFVGIAVVGALLALSFGMAVANVSLLSPGAIGAIVLLLVVFPAFLLLQVLFVSRHRMLTMLLAGESVIMILPFLLRPSLLILSALILVFLFLQNASHYAAKAQSNQLKIKFTEISLSFLLRAFIGLSVFISLAYVHSFHFSLNDLSRETLSHFTQPADRLSKAFGGEGVFDNTPTKAIEQGFLLMIGSDKAKTLSASQKKLAVDKLEKDLQKQYAITWQKDEKLFDAFYRIIHERWQQASLSAKLLLPISIAVCMFTFVMVGCIFLCLFCLPLSFLLYKISLWTGLAAISLEKRDKEVFVCA